MLHVKPKKKKTESQEIAPLRPAGGMTHIKKNSSRGIENAGPEDLQIPRLVLIQPTSDEYLELGYPRGGFAHSVLKESLGTSFDFIPILLVKSRIKWGSEIGDPIECRSYDGKTGGSFSPTCAGCKYSRWQTSPTGEPVKPGCTLYYNFPSIYLDAQGNRQPIAISMASTSIKPAKRLVNLISSSGVDSFARWYRLTSAKEERAKGVSYNYVVTQGDYVEDPDLYRYCEETYEMMKAREVQVHQDHGEECYEEGREEAPF